MWSLNRGDGGIQTRASPRQSAGENWWGKEEVQASGRAGLKNRRKKRVVRGLGQKQVSGRPKSVARRRTAAPHRQGRADGGVDVLLSLPALRHEPCFSQPGPG